MFSALCVIYAAIPLSVFSKLSIIQSHQIFDGCKISFRCLYRFSDKLETFFTVGFIVRSCLVLFVPVMLDLLTLVFDFCEAECC